MSGLTEWMFDTGDAQSLRVAMAEQGAGVPIVVLHGGPGSGLRASVVDLLGPLSERVILFDQRGAGRARPYGTRRHNTTAWLIRDIERLRRSLGIERWIVFGGSWGATLALAYAGAHPGAVAGLVLRGTFLASKDEIQGLFVKRRLRAPLAWQRLNRAAGTGLPATLFARCARGLDSASPTTRAAIADAWGGYEESLLLGPQASGKQRRPDAARRSRRNAAKYRLQMHFLQHGCWLSRQGVLARARAAAAAGIPSAAVHGRRDPVCPLSNLVPLRRAMPALRVRVADGGHLVDGAPLRAALLAALDEIRASAQVPTGRPSSVPFSAAGILR